MPCSQRQILQTFATRVLWVPLVFFLVVFRIRLAKEIPGRREPPLVVLNYSYDMVAPYLCLRLAVTLAGCQRLIGNGLGSVKLSPEQRVPCKSCESQNYLRGVAQAFAQTRRTLVRERGFLVGRATCSHQNRANSPLQAEFQSFPVRRFEHPFEH